MAACLEAGDEIGDELRARFRPWRSKRGDVTAGPAAEGSFRQEMRCPGERSWSSLVVVGLVNMFCHGGRVAAVSSGLAGSRAGGEFSFSVVSESSRAPPSPFTVVPESSWAGPSVNWKAWSLDLVAVEAGMGGGCGRGTGLLTERCHCRRFCYRSVSRDIPINDLGTQHAPVAVDP